MKLKECLEIGKTCGLDTHGECIANIADHATMLFPYAEINKEIDELRDDFELVTGESFKETMDEYVRVWKENHKNLKL